MGYGIDLSVVYGIRLEKAAQLLGADLAAIQNRYVSEEDFLACVREMLADHFKLSADGLKLFQERENGGGGGWRMVLGVTVEKGLLATKAGYSAVVMEPLTAERYASFKALAAPCEGLLQQWSAAVGVCGPMVILKLDAD